MQKKLVTMRILSFWTTSAR